jgi:hypothetical protein
VALLLVASVPSLATTGTTLPPPWPFTVDFGSYLLHVHPEVNYALHPDWLVVWERDRLGRGRMRGTFGSSATDELLVDVHWSLNPELHRDLRLRQDIVWQERRHLPLDRLDIWLGLEQRVWRRLAVVAQATPAERKDTIDLRVGGLWTSPDRTRYVQLIYVLEDLIHDEKDRRNGETETSPLGVSWLVRLEHGPWTFYSEGQWVRRYARRYPDVLRSPDLAAQERASNDLTVRLRWRPQPRAALEAAWFQAEDAELQEFRDGVDWPRLSNYSYDYAGWYRLWSLRGLYPVAERWRLRGELHRLDRRATATGWQAFVYHRDEVMPALFAEWTWSRRRTVELGYLGTFYHWRRTDEDRRREGEDRRGFADKVELALILGLRGEAAIKLSLSHEVSLERFGGGSVRLLTGF